MEPLDSVYLEYKLRFVEDFDWVKGGKLVGLQGGANLPARYVPTGEDGWVVRIMWREDGRGIAYVQHPDQERVISDHFRLENFWFEKGVVQTLAIQVVMNTPGEYDGIVRVWLDGVLVVEETSLRFRDISDLQIEGVSFNTFFGGSAENWEPSKDEQIEFGDLKLFSAHLPGRAESSSPAIP